MSNDFTLPTGETFRYGESGELSEYRRSAERFPSSDKGPGVYLREKLGDEWLSVLRAEHKALSYVKKCRPRSAPASHSISLVDRDNDSYIFKAESYYECASGPGKIERTIKVEQVGSVIDKGGEDKGLTGLARLGRWMHENL